MSLDPCVAGLRTEKTDTYQAVIADSDLWGLTPVLSERPGQRDRITGPAQHARGPNHGLAAIVGRPAYALPGQRGRYNGGNSSCLSGWQGFRGLLECQICKKTNIFMHLFMLSTHILALVLLNGGHFLRSFRQVVCYRLVKCTH